MILKLFSFNWNNVALLKKDYNPYNFLTNSVFWFYLSFSYFNHNINS